MRFARFFAVAFACLTASADAGQLAEIVERTGLSGGLVVCVGGDPGLCEDAAALGDKFLVQLLDTDPAAVAETRQALHASSVHGRITASGFDGVRLPYVDNLINLIVVADPDCRISADEIQRVLAPLGTAVVEGESEVRTWPEALDGWTHWLYGPENNAVSHDRQVGISRSLQWIMPPAWGRHHNLLYSVNAMVSDAGRIYYIMDQAPVGIRGLTDQWTLGCRDAFNGLDLWERPITNWGWHKWSAIETGGTMRFRGPDQLFRRLVAAGDTLFVTLGFNEPVTALDGRTGKILREYAGTEETATIQFKDGTLYLTKNVLGAVPGKSVLAVDAQSGKILWQRDGFRGITPQGNELNRFTDAHLTIGDQQVFLLDADELLALDAKTGQEAWRAARPQRESISGHNSFNFKDYCTLVYDGGRVFLGQLYSDERNLNAWQEKDMDLWAFDAASGTRLWEHTGMSLAHFTPPDLFVQNGLVWTLKKNDVALVGLDAETGRVQRTYPVKEMLVGHHHRCYRNKATENFYLAGEEGIEYIDFETGTLDVHHWMRGACSYGIMPANGLIYLPAHACGCHGSAKLNGFLALANRSASQAPSLDDSARAARLERGPAFDRAPANAKPDPADWPVYKHDNLRSNGTTAAVPDRLSKPWSVDVGGKLTAPTIADGRVYVASTDQHTVHCLDADTGAERWQFVADGRVDTPPTCHGSRVLFGTRSGSVYALDADQGRLAWRFRAAPSDTRLVSHGQLESAWPVNGTVFVQQDKAYVVAGRSTNLDGGLFACVLDVRSGEVLQTAQYQADIGKTGEVDGAVLSDILVGDTQRILIRDKQIDPADIAGLAPSKEDTLLRTRSGGLLDASWYNSAAWEYLQTRAQMLVFDDRVLVGLSAYRVQSQKSYPHDVLSVGDGYLLSAVSPIAGRDDGGKPAGKGKPDKRAPSLQSPWRRLWQTVIPVRVNALILADRMLCVAGAPDIADQQDPWGAFEDRQGGVLMLISKEDGQVVAKTKLDSSPVYDGMAAARGKLYLSLRNGSLVCF